ncbi:MAG: glycosyltransferase [Acidobacteria bacterium]|nr:glycosyltransferase [Acidobacteriota bacterium]
MRYSILLATLGRTTELEPLFRSLAQQTWREFEVLVIDQNPDDRLVEVLERHRAAFPMRRIRSAPGHSRAFNTGLAHATGDIVAFPDDDCWYDPDLLERVARFFEQGPACTGLTGREIVEPGSSSGGRWDSRPGLLTRDNVWRRAITFSMFLRRSLVESLSFDESLGVGAGTPWGAGEETDYLLRAIQQGHWIHYDPSLGVWHRGRSGPYTPEIYDKARYYGRGVGRVLRKHRAPVAVHLIRPLGGALLSLCAGRPEKARYHWSIFAGRLGGWLARPDALQQAPEAQLVSGSQAHLR